MMWVESVSCKAERKNCRVWAGKPAGKRRVGRPRSRGENNINVNLKDMWWGVE
jgi:hypothetical protein